MKGGLSLVGNLVQLMRQLESGGIAVLPVLRHRGLDDHVHFPGQVRAKVQDVRDRIIDMLKRQPDDRVLSKGTLAGQHLVQHRAQTVDIGAVIYIFPECLFRADIGRRSNNFLIGRRNQRFGELRHTKIGNVRVIACIEQHIIRFDIPVDDSIRMSMVKRGCQAFDYESGVPQRKSPLFDHVRKRPARHVAHHEVGLMVILPAHIIDRNDRRMLQGSDQLNFTFEARPRHQVVQHLARQNLDRYFAIGNGIKRTINGRHSTAAQLRFDLVSADFIWRHEPSISKSATKGIWSKAYNGGLHALATPICQFWQRLQIEPHRLQLILAHELIGPPRHVLSPQLPAIGSDTSINGA